MKTYKHLYSQVCELDNIICAWRKARKGKTKKDYVIEFEKNLSQNLEALHSELKNQTYKPKPLKTFVLRDPKTRKISKSEFRDRIVHHALCNIIIPIFDKRFIYDSYANRKGKGNLNAVDRLQKFFRKVSRNGKLAGKYSNQIKGYCFKADIKHYFREIDHKVLINVVQKTICDDQVLWLIKRILSNGLRRNKGMPLGNLTSQFFANVYLDKLDQFVKHKLRAKYYLRYVDDFIILHASKQQLEIWKELIKEFLAKKLKLELHPEKSRVYPISIGVNHIGFRNFYYFKLLRKRSVKKMLARIKQYKKGELARKDLLESYQGWQAYARWANTHKLREKAHRMIA